MTNARAQTMANHPPIAALLRLRLRPIERAATFFGACVLGLFYVIGHRTQLNEAMLRGPYPCPFDKKGSAICADHDRYLTVTVSYSINRWFVNGSSISWKFNFGSPISKIDFSGFYSKTILVNVTAEPVSGV
jgi:hypothetical protein